jgi:hypothetical protein
LQLNLSKFSTQPIYPLTRTDLAGISSVLVIFSVGSSCTIYMQLLAWTRAFGLRTNPAPPQPYGL